jgi:hypothetical protein
MINRSALETYIVEEPNQTDAEESEPVVAQNQRVWCLASHRLLGELLRLLESKSKYEQDKREDDSDAETGSPDGAVVAVMACGGNNV